MIYQRPWVIICAQGKKAQTFDNIEDAVTSKLGTPEDWSGRLLSSVRFRLPAQTFLFFDASRIVLASGPGLSARSFTATDRG